jgi:hypothetical protein
MISAHPNFFFHAESQLTRIYWTYVGDVVNDYITSVTTYPERIAGQPMIQKKEIKKGPYHTSTNQTETSRRHAPGGNFRLFWI